MTICNSQGQTLENVVLWFDTGELGQGAAYVALSCIKSLQSVKFLSPLQMSHFHLVTFSTKKKTLILIIWLER